MTLTAAQRATLKKRKEQVKRMTRVAPDPDQIKDVRDATAAKLRQALSGSKEDEPEEAHKVAEEIEQVLFEANNGIDNEYRATFRRLLISLKNKNTHFSEKLLNGDISAREFATKKVEQLKSPEQKVKDQQLRSEALEQAISHEILPENIKQVHDGRDREKWGVSRSAAAIDD